MRKARGMVMECTYTRETNESMKVCGWRIKEMDKATRDIRMGAIMRGNTKTIKLTEVGFTSGRTERFTMENLARVRSMVMVSGEEFMVIAILESGRKAELVVMEFMFGRMETSTKENGLMDLSTTTELTSLLMEISTRANTKKEGQMVSDSTSGETEASTLDSSKTVLSTEKANGRRQTCLSAINTKETMRWTRSMAMEFSSGRVETYTKGIMLMMKGKAMERCSGLMALFTEESGLKVFSMDMEN